MPCAQLLVAGVLHADLLTRVGTSFGEGITLRELGP